ncbi:14744_t:CDS:1, partial [Dentiscutata erythropus]
MMMRINWIETGRRPFHAVLNPGDVCIHPCNNNDKKVALMIPEDQCKQQNIKDN